MVVIKVLLMEDAVLHKDERSLGTKTFIFPFAFRITNPLSVQHLSKYCLSSHLINSNPTRKVSRPDQVKIQRDYFLRSHIYKVQKQGLEP